MRRDLKTWSDKPSNIWVKMETSDTSPSTRECKGNEICWKCKGNGFKYNKATKKYNGKLCGVCQGSGHRKASHKAQKLAKQQGIVVKLRGSPIDGTWQGPPAHGSTIPAQNDAEGHPSSSLVGCGEIMAALGCGNWRIFQLAAGHKLTVDDFICAWVASEEMRDRGVGPRTGMFGTLNPPGSQHNSMFTHADIGCGCGSVLMTLAWAFPGSIISRGVEAQAVSFDLLQRGLAWNTGANGSAKNTNMHVENKDLRSWDGGNIANKDVGGKGYDLITGTPPYFPQNQFISSQNHNQKVRCRVPTRGAACDYIKAAARLLSSSGVFVMVETSRKEAEVAVLNAVKECKMKVIKRLDVIPRQGLPSRFSCWVIQKDVAPMHSPSVGPQHCSFPITEMMLRLSDEDHHQRSKEYSRAMQRMGWINFEKHPNTIRPRKPVERNPLDAARTIQKRLCLLSALSSLVVLSKLSALLGK